MECDILQEEGVKPSVHDCWRALIMHSKSVASFRACFLSACPTCNTSSLRCNRFILWVGVLVRCKLFFLNRKIFFSAMQNPKTLFCISYLNA